MSCVRIASGIPRRNGLRSIPIFLCRKISHTLRHSSSFAKRHARLACSLVNALTAAHSRCHLFASAPAALFLWTPLHSDFSVKKNQSYAPSFLLFRKKVTNIFYGSAKPKSEQRYISTALIFLYLLFVPRGIVGIHNLRNYRIRNIFNAGAVFIPKISVTFC